jgi:branched-chain amino acid transport system substrate-binding protein
MKAFHALVLVHLVFASFASTASADITIGVSLPLTGPASGLGIPVSNYIKLWPKTLAGEKLNVIVLDDAGDPTKGVTNAKKFISEDKADVVAGSAATPVAIAMSSALAEGQTLQLAFSPAALPPGKDTWMVRLPQSVGIMAIAMVNHMKKLNIKTVGFLGYTDAYGESWLNEFKAQSDKLGGPKIVATERFARTDTSVTAQALKLSSANPQAILIVASGSGAAMPHKAIVERGYKGKIYQTHGAATRDLMRVGGKDVEGSYVVSGPAVVGDQLPATNASKKPALDFVEKYEAAYGKGSRNQLAAHAYDAWLVLEKVVPVALKKGKPGTQEFRTALRDAVETMGRTVLSHGVVTYSKADHWGFANDTGVVLKVVNGDWKVEP